MRSLLCFLLLASSAIAATGDISNVIILSTGFEATCDIAGLSTGGTYDFGLGTNNDPLTGTPKVVFTVVSMGFDDSGNATTITRTVYGIVAERKPYSTGGNQFVKYESGSSPVTVRFVLSEPIYQKDNTGAGNSGTAPTVTFLSGFYTQGGNPSNAASNLAVTNNSTLAYPRVIGNWSRPANGKISGTYRLGVVAFQKFGQSGRPVRCVKFKTADAHSHTATATVLYPSVDASYGDTMPVVEYFADLDCSGFTQGDTGTQDFQAFPWVGDAASVLDTAGTLSGSVAGTSGMSPLYGTRNFICDPNSTYGQGIACVDTTGNDGTGVVSSVLATAAASPYATIAAAITAMKTYNNAGTNNGSTTRNDPGGGIIYLASSGGSQNFAWLGGTPTYGAGTMKTYLTIAAYPGQSRSNVNVNSYSTAAWTGLMIKVQGINFTISSTGGQGLIFPNSNNSYCLVDNCAINGTVNPALWYVVRVVDVVRSSISALNGGTYPLTVNCAPSIIRGNDWPITASTGSVFGHMVIGNRKNNNATTGIFQDYKAGQTAPTLTNTVIAYNYWNHSTAGQTIAPIRLSTGESHGVAIVQNVFEKTVGGSSPCAEFTDSEGFDVNNVILWHNVMVGERVNICYNAAGSSVWRRDNWSVKNNIWDQRAYKTDTFTGFGCTATRSFSAGTVTVTVTSTGHGYSTSDTVYFDASTAPSAYNLNGSGGATITKVDANTFTYSFANGSDPGAITFINIGPHPNRIGNWPIMFGCGCSGNLFNESTGIGVAGTFQPDFIGLKTIAPTPNTAAQPPNSSTQAVTYPKFMNRKSYDGTSSGSGGGDYSLQPSSPAVQLQSSFLLPIDLAGKPRLATDAAGAYSMQRQRAMLLAQ